MVVAYDGTDFHGFAPQAGVRTVAGELTRVLEQVTDAPVEALTCAGRTDAGVHAWGQVVSFTTRDDVDPDRVQQGVNRLLGPEVVVRAIDLAPLEFDARRDATWRLYLYTVVNRPEPDPFLARFAWWVPAPLDLAILRLAADPFVGEHDFAAFCRAGSPGSTTVRRVLESRWHDDGDGVLRYEIRATAFCWQMVRSIVGLLVEIGSGRRTAGDVMAVIRSKDRGHAPRLAPPSGLCLWEVGY